MCVVPVWWEEKFYGFNKNRNKITVSLRKPQKYVQLMELKNRILVGMSMGSDITNFTFNKIVLGAVWRMNWMIILVDEDGFLRRLF